METEDHQYEESCQGEEPEVKEDSSYVSSEYQSADEDSSLAEESKSAIEEDDKTEKEDISASVSVSIDDKKKPKSKIIFNITDSHYPVTKLVGKKVFGWKLSTNPTDDWDICWIDKTVPTETLAKMRPYQKINHFPGILSIARKNNLGKNLMKMKKSFPETYNFFPKTYLLPTDYQEFKSQFLKAKKPKTFIIKPEASSQGKGIFLTKTWEGISPKDRYVAQKYLKKPYLIDGLKFDLRLYVLLAGCDPLRIFLFQDGLGRFATEPYRAPTGDNMDDVCMHLTNYAINKESPNFVFNNSSTADDVGHKKSLKAVFKILEEAGHDTKALWEEIKKIIIKTFCSIQPTLAHNYKSCHPNEPYNNMCFEILGYDIMLDSKMKPWLIEVNHLPSFTTDTPLDKTMKKNVIKDALQIMNINSQAKANFKEKRKLEIQQRAFSSRKVRLSPEEKQAVIDAAQKERDEWESKNNGGFEKIYPLDEKTENSEDYEEYIRVAHHNWRTWTGTEVVKRDTRSSVKRDVSQDLKDVRAAWDTTTKDITKDVTIITEESPLLKSPASTPYKKSNLSLISPKVVSRHSAKRNPSTKAFSGLLNDSNSMSSASHKTAASVTNKNDDLHCELKELGPWGQEKITEYSDGSSFDNEPMSRYRDFNTIEENHNDDEDFILKSMDSAKNSTKKGFMFYKSKGFETHNTTVESTHRDITQTNNGSDSLTNSAVKNIYRNYSKTRLQKSNTTTLPPKKNPPFVPSSKNTNANINRKEPKKYEPKKSMPRSPAPGIRDKGARTPSNKSSSKNNSRMDLDKRPNSPPRFYSSSKHNRPAELVKNAISPRSPSLTRNISSAQGGIRPTSPSRSNSISKVLFTSNESTRKSPTHSKSASKSEKIVKPLKKKVVDDEENEALPKKITLKLGKDSITASHSSLEAGIKKAWPNAPDLIQLYETKIKGNQSKQPDPTPSPHYYQVKLSKDASSPLKIFESKANLTKEVSKISINLKAKVTTTLQEVEMNSTSKILSKNNTSTKLLPPSPKAAITIRNNFFK